MRTPKRTPAEDQHIFDRALEADREDAPLFHTQSTADLNQQAEIDRATQAEFEEADRLAEPVIAESNRLFNEHLAQLERESDPKKH